MKRKKEIKNAKQNEKKLKEPIATKNEGQTRREFIGNLWKGLGIVAAAEFAAVFFGFLFSGKNDEEKAVPKQLFDAGSVESFGKDSVTAFRSGRFYLVRLSDGGFLALSIRCTHLGCSINWEDDKKRFICPCHSSAFYINGEVQNPPAPSALDYFPVIIESGKVKVDIGTKLKRTGFSKNQAAYV
jgi:cytochrome b6-f complex iron-sulfur subunit